MNDIKESIKAVRDKYEYYCPDINKVLDELERLQKLIDLYRINVPEDVKVSESNGDVKITFTIHGESIKAKQALEQNNG